jgi:curved DNA-binding protein CbpA
VEEEATRPSADHVFEWVGVLDALSYYDLFQLAPDASADDVRDAFHAFCDAFHPDRHVMRPGEERDAVSAVFKRGTEAYLVLSDAALRAQYDERLRAPGVSLPPRMGLAKSERPSGRPPGPPKLEDATRSPAARPFARRAEELIAAGDLRQAKLQLVMANHMDSGNDALQAALRAVEAKLLEGKK